MKYLKQLLPILLVVILLAVTALPASADVLVEPRNIFYLLHQDECEHIGNRAYLTNSEAGYVYLYESPGSGRVEKSYSNGEQVRITHLYQDKEGAAWGLINSENGWFRMAELSLVYDAIAFLDEHRGACVSYVNGSYTIEATEENPVILWSYPGGEISGTPLKWGTVTENVSLTYTDASGRVWGYMGYIYGVRNVWVCLSDPHSTTTGGYAVEENTPVLKAPPTPYDEIPTPMGNILPLVIAGVLVAVVVLATAGVIIVILVKQKKQKPNGAE